MENKIRKILQKKSPIKAKEIAKELSSDKKRVNKILYIEQDIFSKNSNDEWSLNELCVDLPSRWTTAKDFEKALKKSGCPLNSNIKTIRFVVPENCYLMLEASARLLALSNQLIEHDKFVVLDFSASKGTLNFLNRNGVLKQLDKAVDVLPRRPKAHAADLYKGNSISLLELRPIDPRTPDRTIPEELSNVFVKHAGKRYFLIGFTIFTELWANVCNHSKTPSSGFAAVQKYEGSRPHIQTVVSDSGIGIIEALKPIFEEKYPILFKKFDLEDQKSGLRLIKYMLENGGITSRDTEDGDGGDGLSRSQEIAVKYSATLSIRQENSELILVYKNGKIDKEQLNIHLPTIHGTHVCFDFIIDPTPFSG